MISADISWVKSANHTTTRSIALEDAVAAIRDSEFRGDVGAIRDTLKASGDKNAVANLKQRLPALLWSGTFSERGNDKLIQHSGLICADLDSLNGDLQEVGQKLRESPHAFAVFLSPSGEGIKAVFRVPADAVSHKGSFRAVQQHVRELTGKEIDQTCKDLARICFLSHDPDTYHNAHAQELTPLPEPQKMRAASAALVNVSDRQRIAAALVGEIDWQSESSGFVRCPGEHLHTNTNSTRDCEIHLDGAPTLHCFHNSCRGILDTVNHELRSRIGKAEYLPEQVSPPRNAAFPLSANANCVDVESVGEEAAITGNGESTPALAKQCRPLNELLDEIVAVLRRFVVFQFPEQPTAIALWVAHTWVLEAADHTPYLHIYSAETASGKSRLLEVLALLVNEPWKVESASPAAIFRRIETEKPTLLYDEIDNVFGGRGRDEDTKDLRACLNSGFERDGTFSRCVGQNANLEVRNFSTFSPKALAGIGKVLSDTLSNRCIPIELIRQMRGEGGERFRKKKAGIALSALRTDLESWSQLPNTLDSLSMPPELPDELTDRQQDICEPLLAIADLAGEGWPKESRSALIKLCQQNWDVVSVGIELLTDIRVIFGDADTDKLRTRDIITELVSFEEHPWALMFEDYIKHDRWQQAASKLAKMLKRYKTPDGGHIGSRSIKQDGCSVVRGYYRDDFAAAWDRYLPEPGLSLPGDNGATSATGATSEGETVAPSISTETQGATENTSDGSGSSGSSTFAESLRNITWRDEIDADPRCGTPSREWADGAYSPTLTLAGECLFDLAQNPF